MTDRDAQMASEFAAGREIPDIAARYDVPTAYVDRVIEEATMAKPERATGLANWENRLLLSVLAAWLLWMLTRQPGAPLVAGVAAFVLTTVIAQRRK